MLFDSDYHIHSYYSDGDYSPKELVDSYIKRKYHQIAITDHDGIEGSKVAIKYAKDKDITILPGIELSSRDPFGNEIHILGYCFDFNNEELLKTLREIKMWRAIRNDKILKALDDKGYEITIDELLAVNGGRFIGKPTFSKILIQKGYVKSIDEAFKSVFNAEPFCEIERKTLSVSKSIKMIHCAGGIAVLAHPMEIKKKDENAEEFANRLYSVLEYAIDEGIDGIECYHPSATFNQAMKLRDFAKECDLIVTGGSDFHSDELRRNYED